MGDTGIILWGNDRWLGFSITHASAKAEGQYFGLNSPSLAFHILSTEQWLEDVNARENACRSHG